MWQLFLSRQLLTWTRWAHSLQVGFVQRFGQTSPRLQSAQVWFVQEFEPVAREIGVLVLQVELVQESGQVASWRLDAVSVYLDTMRDIFEPSIDP